MNVQLKVFILLSACLSVTCAEMLKKIVPKNFSASNETFQERAKRQIPMMYDFGFMDYAAYDYYDWVCNDGRCQVCDVLTGACCDPELPEGQENCFLPDSCANNPCLSGGTCITTETVREQPDFECVCIRGLTGKYCQLIDDFTPQNIIPIPVSRPVPSGATPVGTAGGAAAPGAAAAATGATGTGGALNNPMGSSMTGGLQASQGRMAGLGGAGAGAGGFGGMGGLGGGLGGGAAGAGAGGFGGMGGLGGMNGMGGLGGMGGFGGRKKREAEIAETLFKKTETATD